MSNIEKQIIDDATNRRFCERLMAEFKAENQIAGINILQALHVHSRLRAVELTAVKLPDGSQIPFVATIDLMNLVISGDVETAWIIFNSMVPDDMTQPFHWLSQERLNQLKNKIAGHLGWIG